MAWGKNRVTLQDLEEEFGFGECVGSYRVPGVLSWLEFMSVGIFLGFLVALIRVRLPVAAYAATGGVAVGFTVLNLGWSWLTGRLGVRRYLLYPEGMVKVGWFRPRNWVLWSEVVGTKRSGFYLLGLFSAFYDAARLDLKRADDSTFRISLMGFMPRLPRALATTMDKDRQAVTASRLQQPPVLPGVRPENLQHR
jgi:hypothetical protein